MPTDLSYLLLLFALFVLPKALQRFRIPGAVTAFLLGVGASRLVLFQGDHTVALLATFGIVALFLFAGLEVDGTELRKGAAVLGQHLAVQLVLLSGVTIALMRLLGMEWRGGALLSLALLTPSTGFILDSLASYGLDEDEQYWTRTKAIGAELLALAALFATLQSTSVSRFGTATVALVAVVVLVPLAFRGFVRVVAPFAPKSEFAFLVMLAAACAYATKWLGVYYLIGAFVVGVAAQRFRHSMPALSSERMLLAVEAFSSFFVPFYFFAAGMRIPAGAFGLHAIALGGAFLAVFLPLRVAWVALHRRAALGASWASGFKVGVAMVPSLVFALILASILRERFAISDTLWGALVVYAIGSTVLPSFFLKVPVPEFEEPKLNTGALAQ
jgi:Kef-type K+ transport system membrane component KefB